MTKGELSITTIVIATIALIVLIVLVAIFTGKMGIFGENLASCAAKGGHCASDVPGNVVGGAYQCDSSEAPLLKTDCYKEATKDVCCIPIFQKEVKNNGQG